jgi:hypothetical protein
MNSEIACSILKVSVYTTEREIKDAYHKASLSNHPDKPGGSHEAFLRVKEAYDCLLQGSDSSQHSTASPSSISNILYKKRCDIIREQLKQIPVGYPLPNYYPNGTGKYMAFVYAIFNYSRVAQSVNAMIQEDIASLTSRFLGLVAKYMPVENEATTAVKAYFAMARLCSAVGYPVVPTTYCGIGSIFRPNDTNFEDNMMLGYCVKMKAMIDIEISQIDTMNFTPDTKNLKEIEPLTNIIIDYLCSTTPIIRNWFKPVKYLSDPQQGE